MTVLLMGILFSQTTYAAEPAVNNIAEAPKPKLQREFLKMEWGRDPFSLPERKETPASKTNLQLMGILSRSGKKIAIINKTFVRPGDVLQGYSVTAIESDRVVLNKDGQETVLRITEHEKKS